uniref:Uncharacterized protein n=1 Tax=Vespula pensylvanica TaxID=30213 RepID=A0A834UGI0_VESPE|nr:hypothetical protein H0235_000876 [Vespula pensylvanica]
MRLLDTKDLRSNTVNDIVQRICIATTRVHKDCPQPSSLSSVLVVVSATTILIVIATAIAVAAAASRKIDPNVWLSFMWKPGRVQQKIFSDVNSSPLGVGGSVDGGIGTVLFYHIGTSFKEGKWLEYRVEGVVGEIGKKKYKGLR